MGEMKYRKRTVFNLTLDLAERVRKDAAESGVPISRIGQKALEMYYKNIDTKTKNTRDD